MLEPRSRESSAREAMTEVWPVSQAFRPQQDQNLEERPGTAGRYGCRKFFPARGSKCFGSVLGVSRRQREAGREASPTEDLLDTCLPPSTRVAPGVTTRRHRPGNGTEVR
jgi:hypothetical protein